MEREPAKLEKQLARLSPDEAAGLFYAWREFWARREQLPPEGDWFVWMLRTGRGWGKTRTGAQWIQERAASGDFERIALIGETKADVRDTMIEVGDSAIMSIAPPWCRPEYEPSKRRLTWPNGAVAIVYSGDEPDQLRGPQHDTAWVDELAKFKYPEDTWNNLLFGLRIGPKPQVCVTTTPRPIPLIKRLVASPTTIDVRRPTDDNIENLSGVFIREVVEPVRGTRLGRQEIEGEIIDDVPGALWTRELIESLRLKKAPVLKRIVVAVDPEATSSEESAETGIIVAGVGKEDKHGYILDDLTLKATPLAWARAAVGGYHNWKADRIVAEINQGGEMVELTIRTADAKVAYKGIHASRGKQARAEPVAALYEKGLIHHVGSFPDLEDQLCSWVPGDKSPDRLDALVWALTELMLEAQAGTMPKQQPEQETRWNPEKERPAEGSRWKKY